MCERCKGTGFVTLYRRVEFPNSIRRESFIDEDTFKRLSTMGDRWVHKVVARCRQCTPPAPKEEKKKRRSRK